MGSGLHKVIRAAETNGSAARAAKNFRRRVRPLVSEGRKAELLSGTWLGHSAHPFLTDFPEGAWMAASFLDLFGPEGSEAPAQRLVGFGLLAAVPTAVSGLADWAKSQGPARQSGLVHGVSSTLATCLYLASYTARRRGNHSAAAVIGFAGGVVATLDGWIGGHLSLARGAGVAINAFDEPPFGWTRTSISQGDLAGGRPSRGVLGSMEILVAAKGGEIFGVSARCSFDGCYLEQGSLEEPDLVCPLHGCAFRLRDGSVSRGPASVPLTCLELRIREGRVEAKACGGPLLR